MSVVGASQQVAIGVLLFVFMAAPLFKALDWPASAAWLQRLDLPAPRLIAGFSIAAEVTISVALLLLPRWGAIGVDVFLPIASVVLLKSAKRRVACRCFGRMTEAGTTALIRNAGLELMALWVARETPRHISSLATLGVAGVLAGALIVRNRTSDHLHWRSATSRERSIVQASRFEPLAAKLTIQSRPTLVLSLPRTYRGTDRLIDTLCLLRSVSDVAVFVATPNLEALQLFGAIADELVADPAILASQYRALAALAAPSGEVIATCALHAPEDVIALVAEAHRRRIGPASPAAGESGAVSHQSAVAPTGLPRGR